MADGVDHIDIYADVEEEFNQVIHTYSPHVDDWRFYVFMFLCLFLFSVVARVFRRAVCPAERKKDFPSLAGPFSP